MSRRAARPRSYLRAAAVKKGQTRFDEKLISVSTRGMTCREIRLYLQEIYGVEVS